MCSASDPEAGRPGHGIAAGSRAGFNTSRPCERHVSPVTCRISTRRTLERWWTWALVCSGTGSASVPAPGHIWCTLALTHSLAPLPRPYTSPDGGWFGRRRGQITSPTLSTLVDLGHSHAYISGYLTNAVIEIHVVWEHTTAALCCGQKK